MASTAAPVRATRPSARSNRSGSRPGWRSRRRWCPNSRLLDAPADELTVEQSRQIARGYELVIMHTSTPSFPTDAQVRELLKQDNPHIKIGLVGAKTMVDPEGSLEATNAVDFVCREEFDYTCRKSPKGVPLEGHQGTLLPRRRRPHRAQPAARDNREHGRAAVRRPDLQARSKDRELLHRLPEASLRQLLYRPRLPFEVHVLPVAADRRRPPLPRALGRKRHRRGEVDQGEHARSEGDHVR
jgi:hypothetical protein